ncbi:MAG: TetR/AcrR family transcriptional regulator [Thermoanaerobaculia bacterium]|nr:TetR/AcrR family transcriptional regulator [Thermoanaerobaculia bacterium]
MTTRPNHPPPLFQDDRAGSIYRTAAKMIYEKGFDATSMNEIAEAVELTKPGLYYYVKGKKELLFAIMSFAMDQLDRNVVAPANAITDPHRRLETIVREHARLLTHEPGAVAILIDEIGGLPADQQAAITRRKRDYFDLLRGTLDELRERGELRAVDTTVAAFSLLGMVMWLARWYLADGELSSDEVVRDVTTIALAAVLDPRPT